MLPRTEPILAARALDEIDHWVVPRSRLRAADELLARLGIDFRRVVRVGRFQQSESDLLLVSNSPAPHGGATARSVEYLRRGLVGTRPEGCLRDGRRVRLCRGGSRRIANLNALKPVAQDLGLEIRSADGLAVGEQIDLFSATELLVGVHGAGLANAVFMPRGAALVEPLPL
jgi:hypothetical protein